HKRRQRCIALAQSDQRWYPKIRKTRDEGQHERRRHTRTNEWQGDRPQDGPVARTRHSSGFFQVAGHLANGCGNHQVGNRIGVDGQEEDDAGAAENRKRLVYAQLGEQLIGWTVDSQQGHPGHGPNEWWDEEWDEEKPAQEVLPRKTEAFKDDGEPNTQRGGR